VTSGMEPADVRERFIEPLLRYIEGENLVVEDEIYLGRAEVDELVNESQSHTGFRSVFNDAEVASIVSDRRIEWKTTFIAADPQSSDRVSLLSHLLYHMSMDNYFTWLPDTVKALNNRYSPVEQLHMLKQCNAMPGWNTSVVDGRTFLAGRIVPIILQDDEHLTAWVSEWMRGIKALEKRTVFEPFSNTCKVTKAYKTLEPPMGSLHRIPMLMVLAGVIDHEGVSREIRRYCNATLYDLASGDFSGAFTLTGDDFSRRNFKYGLYLLDPISRQQLIGSYLGRRIIEDNHVELAACVLATTVCWDSEPVSISTLMSLSDHSDMCPVRLMLNEHAMNIDEGWFFKLAANPVCRKLFETVATSDRFIQWSRDYAARSSGLSSCEKTKKLIDWINILSVEEKFLALDDLLELFERGIRHQNSRGRGGMAYAKILLGAFPDNLHVKTAFTNRINHLIRHAVQDKDPEIIVEIVKANAVPLPDIGDCIKSLSQFEALTAMDGVKKSVLLPHLPMALRGEAFAADIGL